MTAKIFTEEIQQIDSFEAYYKNVIFGNNHLIIPYINLGISDHPLNATEKMLFLDFAYMVFEDIQYLDVFVKGSRLTVLDKLNRHEVFHFGGTYLDITSSIFNDMAISCKRASLHTLEISTLSNEMWIPILTPHLKKNIETELSANFFENKYLPAHLRELVK